MTVSAKRFLCLFSFVSNFEQSWHDETLRCGASSKEITWSVGHGDIFYNARRDSSVWGCHLVIRF
jgi:hypothetical protein